MNYPAFVQGLTELFSRLKESLFAYLPSLIAAILIFLVGFVFARVVRSLLVRFVNHLDRLIPNRRMRERTKRFLSEKPVAKISGGLVYWILILFFLAAATETLGLPVVTTWFAGLVIYLPNVLAAILITFGGFVGGAILREMITAASASIGLPHGDLLGKSVQIAVVLGTVLIAVDQVGIDVSLLSGIIMVSIGALFFGASLAFGLGARTPMSNILATFYLQKTYHVGQSVRIADQKGRIIQITPTAVILESPEGQTMVPATQFMEEVSVLLREEGQS